MTTSRDPKAAIRPCQSSLENVPTAHNTNTSNGVFNHVTGHQYFFNSPGPRYVEIPNIQVIMLAPGIAAAPTTEISPFGQGRCSSGTRTKAKVRELRAKKRSLQAGITVLKDKTGRWGRRQRLEHEVLELQLMHDFWQQKTASASGLPQKSED
ncbi:hypothetical protein BDN71DRAFT_1450612 [Pleurotus eryngii]|uniref:Uncharacterized protein n=1 Tax=Pleurotus eryngii TaxID=5323 RepID=A0A9P5ZSU6_PLEER|nr:hypothetical protein BDN71DRAFT_1450612 [Pleurotus eryngii]